MIEFDEDYANLKVGNFNTVVDVYSTKVPCELLRAFSNFCIMEQV